MAGASSRGNKDDAWGSLAIRSRGASSSSMVVLPSTDCMHWLGISLATVLLAVSALLPLLHKRDNISETVLKVKQVQGMSSDQLVLDVDLWLISLV